MSSTKMNNAVPMSISWCITKTVSREISQLYQQNRVEGYEHFRIHLDKHNPPKVGFCHFPDFHFTREIKKDQ